MLQASLMLPERFCLVSIKAIFSMTSQFNVEVITGTFEAGALLGDDKRHGQPSADMFSSKERESTAGGSGVLIRRKC